MKRFYIITSVFLLLALVISVSIRVIFFRSDGIDYSYSSDLPGYWAGKVIRQEDFVFKMGSFVVPTVEVTYYIALPIIKLEHLMEDGQIPLSDPKIIPLKSAMSAQEVETPGQIKVAIYHPRTGKTMIILNNQAIIER